MYIQLLPLGPVYIIWMHALWTEVYCGKEIYLVAEHGFSKDLQAATWLTFGQHHLPPSLLWPVIWHALYVTQNLMLLAHMWAVFCGYPTMHHDILAQTAALSQPKPLIWKLHHLWILSGWNKHPVNNLLANWIINEELCFWKDIQWKNIETYQ
jgi:hypothetical protein